MKKRFSQKLHQRFTPTPKSRAKESLKSWFLFSENKEEGAEHSSMMWGFTTIELIVGVSIVVLLSIALFSFQKDVFSLNTIISNSIVGQSETRRAFKFMTAEIRSTSQSSIGSYPIAQAATSSITFYSDSDDDGLKERIRYFLQGTTLKKGVLKPTGNPFVYDIANETISDVVHDVTNGTTTTFYYYNSNYTGTTSPLTDPVDVLAVRLVKIVLTIDHDSRSPSPLTVTTQVTLRNIKDNL